MPYSIESNRQELIDLLAEHRRWLVITGAGCSTESGIPDYRDTQGAWKRPQPVDFDSFVSSAAVRQRYWARSMTGWRHFGQARPNAAHRALAAWEQTGGVVGVLTQNVDGLHQVAGSQAVIDLHGRIDRVACLRCQHRWPRALFQSWLLEANPEWAQLVATPAPDGDADLEGVAFHRFVVPECPRCGGILKPDVVFFGETVPANRVAQARSCLQEADAVLVVGSSLMLLSGFRYVREATALGLPVAALNLGRTRADELLTVKLPVRATELPGLLDAARIVKVAHLQS